MPSGFITKRPHKKSRGGCQTCKTKKVKCDEAQPRCSFCEKRNFVCIYTIKPSQTSTPPPSRQSPASIDFAEFVLPGNREEIEDVPGFMDLVTVPRNALIPAIGNLSLTDLRMMHHWSTATWDKLTIGPENSKVLLNHVTSLAFESDFLLNCILGISSLHKEHLLPDSQAQKNQTAIYRVKALNGFREALARISLDSLNWEAALIMAILIIILCSKDYDRGEVEDELSIIKWLVLYRGVSSIISMKSYTEVLATGVHPIFRCELVPLTITPATPRSLLRLVENIDILDPDFECRSSYCGMLNALSTLYGSLKQNGLCDDLFIRTITLASHGSQQFCVVSREKRPRPLIILAHLLIFIKLISNRLWWLKGMSDKEITAIARIVGPEWLSYLEVPIAATKTTDKAEIVKLLMS